MSIPPRPTAPVVPIEHLLEHADWVQRLAVRIAGPDADDLAQDVWLTVLRQPPSSARNLRHWLATLLRSRARDRTRSESRRVRREQKISEIRHHPSAAELATRAEQHRNLVDRVLILEEPMRSTLLAHYFERLRPVEIARRQGLPVETVKSRLRRGLAILQRSYRQDEDAGASLLLLLPLPVTSKLTAAVTLAGLILMTTKTKVLILAVALLVVSGAVVYTGTYGGDPDRELRSDLAPISQLEATETTGATGSTLQVTADRQEVTQQSPEPTGRRVFGSIVGLHPDLPWTEPVNVQIKGPESVDQVPTFEAELAVDANGLFEFVSPIWGDEARDSKVVVRATNRGYARIHRSFELEQLDTTEADRLVIQVKHGCIITGYVRSEALGPVDAGRLSVHAMRDGRPLERALCGGRIMADGKYEVLVAHDGPVLVVAFATGSTVLTSSDSGTAQAIPNGDLLQYLNPGACQVVSVMGSEVAASPIILSTTVMITGRVLWADGSPVSRAVVRCAAATQNGTSLQTRDHHFMWWPNDVVTRGGDKCQVDSNGKFELVAFREHSTLIELAHAPDVSLFSPVRRTVQAPCSTDLIVGGAVLDLRVQYRGEAADVDVSVETSMEGSSRSLATPTPNGRVRIALEPGCSYQVSVLSYGRKPHKFTYKPEHAGCEQRLVQLEDPDSQTVTLRLQSDSPPQGLRIRFSPIVDASIASSLNELRGKNGVFRIPGKFPGRYRITLLRPEATLICGDSYMLETSSEIEVLATGTTDVQVPCTLGGRLRIQLKDSSGLFLAATCTLEGPDGKSHRPNFRVRARGRVRTTDGTITPQGTHETDRNLPVGSYMVVIESPDRQTQRLPIEIRGGAVATLRVRF